MSRDVQQKRGTTAEIAGLVGLEGQLIVDTDKETVVVMDGVTPGGFPLARADEVLTPSQAVTGVGISQIVRLTQFEYDNLSPKVESTLYVIVGANYFMEPGPGYGFGVDIITTDPA